MKHRKPPRKRPQNTKNASSVPRTKNPQTPDDPTYEADVLAGLADLAEQELKQLSNTRILSKNTEHIKFRYNGPTSAFGTLRLISAINQHLHFDVPRPKALLGDQHYRRLNQTITRIRQTQTFTSFRFAAAGSNSSVFTRLADALTKSTGLAYDPENGDLVIRVVPGASGWDVAIRLTPRPLSARSWRVCNREGGLNATLAAAMNDISNPNTKDHYLNAMCGSGTLLIERALAQRAKSLTGIDINPDAIKCAQQNINSSGVRDVVLLEGDVCDGELVLPVARFDVITADLPWGDAVGSHEQNALLYPRFLAAAGRLSHALTRLVVLTHEVKLFERVLGEQSVWQVKRVMRVAHSGHHPRLYLLVRSS